MTTFRRPLTPEDRRRADDDLIAQLVAASKLEHEVTKRELATDIVVAGRAIAAIRKKLDEETALGDEVRALPALISNRRRLLEALKLVKEKTGTLGLDLDDEDEATPPPRAVAQTSAPSTDDDDVLADIRGDQV